MEEYEKRMIERMINDLEDLEFKYTGELNIPERCRDAIYELKKIID